MTTIKPDILYSKGFFPALLPLIGKRQYDLVVDKYTGLYKNYHLPQNPDLQKHLINGILPGFAYYQVLKEEGKTSEEAIEIFNKTFEQIYLGYRNKYKKIGQLPFAYGLLRIFIKKAMKPFSNEGWQLEWTQNDQEAIRFNMYSCFYLDSLTKLGAPELTKSYCRVDDFMYEEMSPHIEWKRTKTIGRGDKICDFCFLNISNKVKQ